MVETAIGILGLAITIVILVFTDQGREFYENVRYHIARLARTGKSIFLRNDRHHANLVHGDKSVFVRDVTIPDGTKVVVGQRFTKIWEIRNAGSVIWEERFLQREGPTEGPGRLKSPSRVRIPHTFPGQSCQVKVRLIAPPLPGSCYAEWKMVDSNGTILLPAQKPVYISVDVVQ